MHGIKPRKLAPVDAMRLSAELRQLHAEYMDCLRVVRMTEQANWEKQVSQVLQDEGFTRDIANIAARRSYTMDLARRCADKLRADLREWSTVEA